MIKKLLIIRDTGICMSSFNFTSTKNEEQDMLISGFFTALVSFGEQTITSTDETRANINVIEFQKNTYYFSRKGHFLYVVEVDSASRNLASSGLFEDIIQDTSALFEKYCTEKIFDLNSCALPDSPSFNQEIRDIIARATRRSLFRKATAAINEV
jgi:hypothetical protein